MKIYRPKCGETIREAVEKAIALSIEEGETVQFNFSKVATLKVNPSSDVDTVVRMYLSILNIKSK